MVTALDQPADRVRGLKAGADDFPDQAGERFPIHDQGEKPDPFQGFE
jgi:hypothetical protein